MLKRAPSGYLDKQSHLTRIYLRKYHPQIPSNIHLPALAELVVAR